ncbi:MAG: hypothetical protein AAFV71_18345 [Cyanobacteria bacterium J06633_8]
MTSFEFSRKTTSNRKELAVLNADNLKGVLSYFSYLYANGEISDKALEALVRHACSIFIENEVEIIFQETLERKFMTFLRSKFAGSEEDIESAIYSLDVFRNNRSR